MSRLTYVIKRVGKMDFSRMMDTAKMLHKKTGWKILHFAFIIPAIIFGNSLRIVLTVLLYSLWGKVVLQNTCHTVLGYVQIVLALLFFLVIGKVFTFSDPEHKEEVQ